MLHLIKLFLVLCLSAIMSGCPILTVIFGSTAFEGYELMRSEDTVVTAITVEQPIGFATLKGNYDLLKADKSEGVKLMSDDFCIIYGSYAGYTDSDGLYVPENTVSVFGAGIDTKRVYQSTWAQLHAGSLTGGTSSTNYMNYFVEQVLGMNPANFRRENNQQTSEGILYEYYSCRDVAQGQDYMLKLFYNSDKTGVVYLYGVRDYTLSNAPVLDNFEFADFTPDKSFALNSEIADYTGGNGGSTALFSVEAYEGAWDSGIVTIDGTEYNLHAQNLRTLETQGVTVFDDKYKEQGYDTPIKSSGKADVQFLFGDRLLTLHLELKGGDTCTLIDAKILGFTTNISNNFVTDEEKVHGSQHAIQPSGAVVDEQTFVDTYYGGSPYYTTIRGETHYYTGSGHEITYEQYKAILNGEKIDISGGTSEERVTEPSTADGDVPEEVDGDVDTEEDSEGDSEESTDDSTEETPEETSETSPVPSSEGGSGFGELGNHGDSSTMSEADNSDWLVIGGLHHEVTLASLEVYLNTYATSYETAGSGNSIKYTVHNGSAIMKFTLEKSSVIVDMEVMYENG